MDCREFDTVRDQYHPVFRDLTENYDAVQKFIIHNPNDSESFLQRHQRLTQIDTRPSQAIIDQLVHFNRKLGASTEAVENLKKLSSTGVTAVITGQQPGVMTGPLFSIYKAVTAVRLARRLEHQIGQPVIPLYWIASDDHDIAEIKDVNVVTDDGHLHRLSYGFRGDEKRSAGEIPFDRGEGIRLIGAVDELIGQTPHSLDVYEYLRSHSLDDVRSISDWFGRIMLYLFRETGLALVDPQLPAIRHQGRSLLQQVLARHSRIHSELSGSEKIMKEHGYRPVLNLDADHSNLFLHRRNERTGLFWRSGRLSDRRGELDLTASELAKQIEGGEADVSPNVVIRPILQDHLFPTISYVAGPGETAYLAQMKDVYPLFQLEQPVLYPRINCTLVAHADRRFLIHRDTSIREIWENWPGVYEDQVARLQPFDIEAEFKALKLTVSEEYRDLAAKIERISDDLSDLSEENLKHILNEIDYLENKACQHHRRQHRELSQRLRRIRRLLFPRDGLQERQINGFQFIYECGFDFIDELIDAVPLKGRHQVIIFDDCGEGKGSHRLQKERERAS